MDYILVRDGRLDALSNMDMTHLAIIRVLQKKNGLGSNRVLPNLDRFRF